MKLPEEVRPIWRTIQMVQISRGLDQGLRVFIVGPFFYEIFKRLCGQSDALFYTSLVWAIYCGLIAILEVPTGAFADIFGRVRVVISSLLLNIAYGLGLTSLILFHDLTIVLIVAILAFSARALSYSLYNGSFNAWVVDSIREVSPQFGYERLLARGSAYYKWSQIIGGVLGVALYLQNIPYVAFMAGAIICLCCAGYCIGDMKETQAIIYRNSSNVFDNMKNRLVTTVRTAFTVCNKHPILWYLLIIFATFEFLLDVVGYLWPVAMTAQFGTTKWGLAWYGMVFSVPLVAAVGSHVLYLYGDRIQKSTGTKLDNAKLWMILMGHCLLASLPIIFLGIMNHMNIFSFPIFAAAILLLEYSEGVIRPVYTTLVNNYIPDLHSSERATILSIGSLMSGLLMLLLLVPSSGQSANISAIGWILPACALLLVSVGGRLIMQRRKMALAFVESASTS